MWQQVYQMALWSYYYEVSNIEIVKSALSSCLTVMKRDHFTPATILTYH